MPNINFRELMEDTSETVQRPKSAPECWLTGTIGQSWCDTTKPREGEGTPFIAFDLTKVSAHPDNSPEIIEALGGFDFSKMRSPYRKTLTAEFWLTPEARFRLTNALDRVVGGRNRTIRERVPEMQGQLVMFKVRPRRTDDGEDTGQNDVLVDTLTKYSVSEQREDAA